jgi:copper(I)-binding protein
VYQLCLSSIRIRYLTFLRHNHPLTISSEKIMIKLTNWTGLCLLILSLQAYGGDLNIQDAWIRPITPGQEEAIVGMVINSTKAARIIAVISPAYTTISMQGPGKNGAGKTQELEFIDLPAKKSVLLEAESVHLLLSGNKQTISTNDKIPVIVTLEFDDKTSKTFKILTMPVGRNVAAAVPVLAAPSAPRNHVESSNKEDDKTTTPPATTKAQASPVEASSPAKPVAATKPSAAEVKRAKTAPAAEPKPTPAVTRVTPAPLLPAPQAAAPVVAPVPVVAPPAAAPTPVAAAPVVSAPIAEPKKAPESKPAEQVKPDESKANTQCLKLAEAIRSCDPSNDTVLAWCESNAKSRYPCTLSMEQLKKLKN